LNILIYVTEALRRCNWHKSLGWLRGSSPHANQAPATVWSFFGPGVTDYLLFIVGGFIGVVIALQLILSGVRRPTEIANSNTNQPPSFHDWVRGDFDTENGPLSSADAAIIILLPIVAAAIGMMTFGIEFLIVKHAV
jgi:hypothetical protein